MENEQVNRLKRNESFLVRTLTGNVQNILDYMIENGVLEEGDFYKIARQHNPDSAEKVRRLISRLSSCNNANTYQCFCDALKGCQLDGVLEKLNQTDPRQRSISGRLVEGMRKQNMELLEHACHNPPRNTHFTGRKQNLEDLYKTLHPYGEGEHSPHGNQIVTVFGLGGAGKSQLINEYVHLHRDEYQLVYWIRCGNNNYVKSMTRFAKKLGIVVENVAEMDVVTRVYEMISKATSYLVVFDYADKEIEKFLPGEHVDLKHGHHIIITTHSSENCRSPFEVDVFTKEDAFDYVSSRLHNAGHFDSKNQSKIEELVHLLGRLPLALSQAVAYIKRCGAACSIDAYVQSFNNIQTHHEMIKMNITFDNHPSKKSVFGTLFTSVERVVGKDPFFKPTYGPDEDAATLLKCLSVLDSEEIPLDLFKGCPLFPSTKRLREAVAKLRDFALIRDCQHKEHVRIHKLVQNVIREYKEQDLGDSLPHMFAETVAQPLTEAIVKVMPEGGDCINWGHIDRENMEKLKILAAHVQTLLSHIETALDAQRRYEENEEDAYAGVLQVLNKCKVQLLEQSGYSGYYRRDFAEAVTAFRNLVSLQRSLARVQEEEDLTLAKFLMMLGICERLSHNHEVAVRCLVEALEIIMQRGPDLSEKLRRRQIEIIAAKGKTYYFMDDCDTAHVVLTEALELHRRYFADDEDLMAYILPKIGNVEFKKGNIDIAKDHFENCLNIRRKQYERGEREHILIGVCQFGVAKTLMGLKGQLPVSENLFLHCLESARSHYGDNHAYVGKVHGALGKCLILQKRLEEARYYLAESLNNFARNYGVASDKYNVVLNWYRHASSPDTYSFEDSPLLFMLGF